MTSPILRIVPPVTYHRKHPQSPFEHHAKSAPNSLASRMKLEHDANSLESVPVRQEEEELEELEHQPPLSTTDPLLSQQDHHGGVVPERTEAVASQKVEEEGEKPPQNSSKNQLCNDTPYNLYERQRRNKNSKFVSP